MQEIIIGNNGADYVSIIAGSPNCEGWFDAPVEVRCGGWSGNMNASFMKGELRRLAEELHSLQKNLTGTAQLDPLEPYITMTFAGDGKGHISVSGDASIHLGSPTHLQFAFEIDQTYLSGIIKALLAADPA